MKAVFVELPPFERYRADYLDDAAFSSLQAMLMEDPEAGDVIQEPAGCARLVSRIRVGGRATRWPACHLLLVEIGSAVWLFTLYGKDEADDLSAAQRKILKALLENEVRLRRRQ